MHGWSRFESLQAYYTIAGRDLERELAPVLADQQMGLMLWSRLAGGFLSVNDHVRLSSSRDDRSRWAEQPGTIRWVDSGALRPLVGVALPVIEAAQSGLIVHTHGPAATPDQPRFPSVRASQDVPRCSGRRVAALDLLSLSVA